MSSTAPDTKDRARRTRVDAAPGPVGRLSAKRTGGLGLGLLMLISAGSGLFGQEFAYIANISDDTVSVIDTAQRAVVDVVSVGLEPSSVAIHPQGTKVYVANSNDSGVSVIRTTTNLVVKTIPLYHPYYVAMPPDGSFVYVLFGGETIGGGESLGIIDTRTDTVVDTLTPGGLLRSLAVRPDGSEVWVVAENLDSIQVIDTGSNTLVDTISLGVFVIPSQVTFDPVGERAYVTKSRSDEVAVIDTGTNTVIATPAVGDTPIGLSVTPDGTHLYVANLFSNTVSIIDTATNLVVDTLGGYTRAHDVAVHPNGAEVYVTETSVDRVAVISVASKTRIDTIFVGDQPFTEGVFIGPGPALFASYFETGDTSEWSSTRP